MRFETSRAMDHIDADLPEDYDLDDEEPADEDVVEAEAVAYAGTSLRFTMSPGRSMTPNRGAGIRTNWHNQA
jgi:hypothetical protein